MSFFSKIAKAKKALALNAVVSAEQNRRTLGVFLMVGIALIAFAPGMAAAAPWDSAAQKILEIFTGGFARTLAIIAVIACGIAAIAGKLSWDWAIKIIVGIVLIFGATAIVDYVIAGTS
jgi:type IV secretory pathway VirB2 component (pilin)